MDLKNKRIVVVGMGRTGYAVARFCARRGAEVTVSDRASAAGQDDRIAELKTLGVRLELGGHRDETFGAADLIVMSPGVPHDITPVRRASEAGIPVTGEIELAARFIDTPIVAVSGTNGKTTTCELLAQMLARSGRRVFLGGNIGNPLISYPDAAEDAEVLVVEISSFQLDTIETFHPRVAVLLNITPDHLDRYADFGAYAASKMRLFTNQRREDVAVLNAADDVIAGLSGRLAARRLYFPALSGNRAGARLEGPTMHLHGLPAAPAVIELSRLKLPGAHNRENACAAALAALAAGGSLAGVQAAVDSFSASPHRLEPVATIDGVDYVNDSKATNVDAVARALTCFERPTILIMGGSDKGSPFEMLSATVSRHSRLVIVIGAAADRIAAALEGAVAVVRAANLKAAVETARKASRPGETVLLSPGCASFDHYTDYRARGEDFRAAVKALAPVDQGSGSNPPPPPPGEER